MDYRIEIHPDGRKVEKFGENAKAPTLEEAQAFVGGWIEIQTIRLEGQSAQMVLNEEGKLMDLPVNHLATALWLAQGHADAIVGPVLLLTGKARLK